MRAFIEIKLAIFPVVCQYFLMPESALKSATIKIEPDIHRKLRVMLRYARSAVAQDVPASQA